MYREYGVIIAFKLCDLYGNILDESWSFYIDLNAQNFAIQLDTGWNLVSIPFEPPNRSIASVLGSISGSYDCVRAYDASDAQDHWKVYSVDMPANLNDLSELDRNLGFWVHVTRNCTLWVSGTPENVTAIELHAGWNLVGYPTLNGTITAGDALWGTSADKMEGFDSSTPYLLKELTPTYLMKPGEGYWVHVPSDTVWIINW